MSKNNGGPAFPVANYDHQTFQTETVEEHRRLLSGMTLRDYFAAHAPITFQDAVWVLIKQEDRDFTGAEILEMLALMRIGYADAMLKEREK